MLDPFMQGRRSDQILTNVTPTKNLEQAWSPAIFTFFLVCIASSWVVWLWPVHTQGWLRFPLFGSWHNIPLSLVRLLIGNCLPGILAIIWSLFEGKAEFRSVLATLSNWRAPVQWYVVAIGLPLMIFLIAWNVVLFFFPLQHPALPISAFFIGFLINLPFAPLWEEIAWRAFALRKLESGFSGFASALILGIYWAVWHIPLWLILLPNSAHGISVILAASARVVAWSIIWAYLYHRSSESLPVVIVLHSAYNAVWNWLATSVPLQQFIYVSAALAACLAVFFARGLAVRTKVQP